MGLALGKSISEIRALPYEEFYSWKAFYKLEPWGWHDNEYRTAVMLTQMWNMRATKQSQAKKVEDYFRDMPDLLTKSHQSLVKETAMKEKMRMASKEERKALIAKALGTTLGKEVKIEK